MLRRWWHRRSKVASSSASRRPCPSARPRRIRTPVALLAVGFQLPSPSPSSPAHWLHLALVLELALALALACPHQPTGEASLSSTFPSPQYVLEFAFEEFFLQRYPRESPGPMRERVYWLIGKRFLPKWIKAASLNNLVFPYDDINKLIRKEWERASKSVFWALFSAIYLCFGMPEVYRVLFETFGMDSEDESCQPRMRRQLEDVDYVSMEFEGRQLTWQDVAAYKSGKHLMKMRGVHPQVKW